MKQLVVLTILILVFASLHNAQTSKVFKIDIPFDFLISDQTFPAGEYSIGRLNEQSPDLLFVRSADGKRKIVIGTHRVDTKERLSRSMLSFINYRNSFFLASIWTANESYGSKLSTGSWKPAPGIATESKVVNLFEAERR